MVGVPDVVELGLVTSLARPGGNVTGLTVPFAQLGTKHLEIVKEFDPRLASVAVLWNQPPPDDLEKRIRFGCGFIVGAILGFIGTLLAFPDHLPGSLLVGAGVALLFGVLAVRYGDRFWYGLRHVLWFWP